MYVYTFICVSKCVHRGSCLHASARDPALQRYHLHIYIYIYIYMHVFVNACIETFDPISHT